jgi:hypothetical protein
MNVVRNKGAPIASWPSKPGPQLPRMERIGASRRFEWAVQREAILKLKLGVQR